MQVRVIVDGLRDIAEAAEKGPQAYGTQVVRRRVYRTT